MHSPSLEQLRRDATRLKKAFGTGEAAARQRVAAYLPNTVDVKQADALHVIAREQLFESWPRLVAAAEAMGLDRAAAQQRLKVALLHGQNRVVADLLDAMPDLSKGLFGLSCALYDRAEVARMLGEDPALAVQPAGPRSPILHLAFSRWIKARPEREADMLAVAELLLSQGADVNDGYHAAPGDGQRLSALYGAIGHADNMVLGRWLLEHGADPDDGESLYHATELGHLDGLRLLLTHGADPRGTNAVLRAMDFHDHAAVALLLEHGARPDEGQGGGPGGKAPSVIPALHHAARRGSDARMVALLLDAGADAARVHEGASAYGYARVHGTRPVIEAIEARGVQVPLSREEALMARAAEGLDSPGEYIDPARLPEAYGNLIREILHLPGKLDQIARLVALGLPYDAPDAQGITPVQMAGWEGLPDVMGYLLSLRPDLSHVNGYGGTLLTTILHGSDNNPTREGRDYLACLRLALEAGAALPRRVAGGQGVGRSDVAEFLADWALRHPGQVI